MKSNSRALGNSNAVNFIFPLLLSICGMKNSPFVFVSPVLAMLSPVKVEKSAGMECSSSVNSTPSRIVNSSPGSGRKSAKDMWRAAPERFQFASELTGTVSPSVSVTVSTIPLLSRPLISTEMVCISVDCDSPSASSVNSSWGGPRSKLVGLLNSR